MTRQRLTMPVHHTEKGTDGSSAEEDHKNAKLLAEGIARIDGIELDETQVKTNILFFKLTGLEGTKFITELEKQQIKILMTGEGTFRAVMHREVSRKQVEIVIETFRLILRN